MMKRKVLFFIESLGGGGAEKVLSVLISNLNKNFFDITVCSVVDGGKYTDVIRESCKYKFLLRDYSNLNCFQKVKYIILYHLIYHILPCSLVYKFFLPKNNDIEIAFVEGFSTKIISNSTNRKAKKIAWIHTDLLNNHWISSVYKNKNEEYKSYLIFDKVIGVSDNVCESYKMLYHIDNIIRLYNPVDVNDIIYKSIKPVAVFNSSINKIRIISVGRYVPQKSYDRLLRIIVRLVNEGYKINLYLLGDGPQREELSGYIEMNNMHENIKLLGFKENPYAYLSKCDLFICSSISEGYSTAVTEALILGMPVITTNCSGMKELLDNGKYGVITENSEKALYLGLKDLLDNPQKLDYYKKKSQEHSKKIALSNLMQPIEETLESL